MWLIVALTLSITSQQCVQGMLQSSLVSHLTVPPLAYLFRCWDFSPLLQYTTISDLKLSALDESSYPTAFRQTTDY